MNPVRFISRGTYSNSLVGENVYIITSAHKEFFFYVYYDYYDVNTVLFYFFNTLTYLLLGDFKLYRIKKKPTRASGLFKPEIEIRFDAMCYTKEKPLSVRLFLSILSNKKIRIVPETSVPVSSKYYSSSLMIDENKPDSHKNLQCRH